MSFFLLRYFFLPFPQGWNLKAWCLVSTAKPVQALFSSTLLKQSKTYQRHVLVPKYLLEERMMLCIYLHWQSCLLKQEGAVLAQDSKTGLEFIPHSSRMENKGKYFKACSLFGWALICLSCVLPC